MVGIAFATGEVLQLSLIDPPWKSLVPESTWEIIGRFSRLTERECTVCRLLFEGATRQAVAEQLGVKFSTVRKHTEKIHLKLGVNTRAGMAQRIIQIRDLLELQQQRN